MDWALEPPMFNVSQELREKTINTIDDLVNDIAPGYLIPNPIFRLNYTATIYEEIYKYLWSEFGRRRYENVDYRDEIFDFLREVPSEKFFDVTEHLLKIVFQIVHIEITIPDDIIRDTNAGNKKWSRNESVRDRHIKRFKGAVDILNRRLSQHNAKYRYDLGSGFVQMVSLDTGSDVPEENNDIQEPTEHHQNQEDSEIQPHDNQIQKHHQSQSRSELWNRRNCIIAFVALVFILLDFAFGNSILIRLWDALPTIKEKISGWFR